MRTRVLRRPIIFLHVRCSILTLLIKTVRCSIPHCIFKLLVLATAGLGAARSKAWVCGRSPAEIAGSNPSEDMDVCLL